MNLKNAVGPWLVGPAVLVALAAPGEAFAGTYPGINGRLVVKDDRAPASLSLLSADGVVSTPLPSPAGAAPSFASASANGRIVFQGWDTTADPVNYDIFMMRDDGSRLRNLTRTPETNEHEPAISAGADMVAYSKRDRQGDREIILVNLGVGGRTLLTENREWDDKPIFSPDGDTVAFARRDDGDTNWDMYDVDVESLQERALAAEPTIDEVPGSYSPDGTRLAYERDGEILHMDAANGGDVFERTANQGSNFNPTWSPDGLSIAFERASGGRSRIMAMPAYEGAAEFVSPAGVSQRLFDWQAASNVIPPTSTCLGELVDYEGTKGRDFISLGKDSAIVNGLGGGDVITGSPEADILCGGDGRDLIRGGAGKDDCDGGKGRDETRSC